MPVNTQFQNDGEVLYVKATGSTNSLQDILMYAETVLTQAFKHNISKVITDETELVYGTATLDIYESAKTVAETTGFPVEIVMVIDPAQRQKAERWETVAVNRGLNVRLASSCEEAKEMLRIKVA